MVWVVLLASGRNRACRSGKTYGGPRLYSTCETAALHLSYLIPSQDMPAGIGWNGGDEKTHRGRISGRSERVLFFGHKSSSNIARPGIFHPVSLARVRRSASDGGTRSGSPLRIPTEHMIA